MIGEDRKTLFEEQFYLMFRSTDPEMALAWTQYFSDSGPWSFGIGDILREKADAIVSPANSFGHMDGGIDRAYRNFFGLGIQNRVQSSIKINSDGELPVGKALIIPTSNIKIPMLIVAPTMKTPKDIRGTDNVYHAMRAVVEKTLLYNQYQAEHDEKGIRDILVPSLGTGYGMMNPFDSAEQMRKAIDDINTDLVNNNNCLDYLVEKNH